MLPAGLIIFLSACLHEDVAILAAAYFVVEQDMSPLTAAALAFSGMMANNLTLYLLGASTRRHPWVRRWLMNERARKIRHRLNRHLVTTLALSRLGQSMLTPALLGCGWLHVPLRRVLPVVAATAALYLGIMLALVIAFGQVVVRELSNWVGTIPVVLVVVIAFLAARRQIVR